MSEPLRQPVEKFNELFASNRLDILRFLARRSTSADAADALSETFLVAWNKIDSVPPGLDGRLWLFGVARNILLRQSSQKLRTTALNERLASELRSATVAVAHDERLDRVRDALSRLSRADREIVELSAWEELSPSEIATVMGITANAARVRLHRAKLRVNEILETSEPTAATISDATTN